MKRLVQCVAIGIAVSPGLVACKSDSPPDTSRATESKAAEARPGVSSTFDERLFRAAQRGSRATVSARLDDGAAVNAKNPENGWTALHAAAYNGHKKLVAYLLTRGADPNSQDHEGNTALHLAASLGHDDTTVALIGVTNLALRNKSGRTPREVANPRLAGFFPSDNRP